MTLYLPEQASTSAKSRLARSKTVNALNRTGTPSLVYDPALSEDDVLLLHFPFSWDEGSPSVAAACTCGLSESVQSSTRRWCFQAFELVFAFYSPGFSTALLHQILLLTRSIREWTAGSDPQAFGIGDWIEHFPLLAGRPSAILVPPAPELVQAGLVPHGAALGAFNIRDWANPDVLVQTGTVGYLQVVPLFASEYAHVAKTGDGFRFFLDHLLPSDAEFASGKPAGSRLLDMGRPPVM